MWAHRGLGQSCLSRPAAPLYSDLRGYSSAGSAQRAANDNSANARRSGSLLAVVRHTTHNFRTRSMQADRSRTVIDTAARKTRGGSNGAAISRQTLLV